MNVLSSFLNWGAGVLKVIEDTAYPDLNDRLNAAEEEHEVWEPDEIVAPPATLDDIFTVLGDIHDLLATHYASSAAPVSADVSPTTTGRVGEDPAGVDGTPLQPPPAGQPTTAELLTEAGRLIEWAMETRQITSHRNRVDLVTHLRDRARTFEEHS